MSEPLSEVKVSGFDPWGEPTIRKMSDGSIHLVFEAMPPFEKELLEDYFLSHFEDQLKSALGVPVLWDDRELFVFAHPNAETAKRLEEFLKHYWENPSRSIGVGIVLRVYWFNDFLLDRLVTTS